MTEPDRRDVFETIYLDKLDGAGFERLCCSILERAGWGTTQLTGGVADGGFDIIVHGREGKMIVKCRHRPQFSIGRSIVQRLRSAVISEKAARGVIITTGSYAREASDYVEKLPRSTPIHLCDRLGLDILAERAGIKLVPYARPGALMVIEQQTKINDAMNQLADRLKRDGKYMGYKTMRHKDGLVTAPLYWFKQHRFWWAHLEYEGNRYWNAFGTAWSEEGLDKMLRIVCEINFPLDNLSPSSVGKIAGAFAREDRDRVCIVHSGRLSTKKLKDFKNYSYDKLDWRKCVWYDPIQTQNYQSLVRALGLIREVVFISSLDDLKLEKIRQFVVRVKKFKAPKR